jgi:hypothetical protein
MNAIDRKFLNEIFQIDNIKIDFMDYCYKNNINSVNSNIIVSNNSTTITYKDYFNYLSRNKINYDEVI